MSKAKHQGTLFRANCRHLHLTVANCYDFAVEPHAILTPAHLKRAGIATFFRPHEVEPLDIAFRDLGRLVARGVVERVGHGLYRLSAVEATEHETVAMVSAAIPGSIICLLTALSFHGIGTQLPREVWIALDRKARKPARSPAMIRVMRFSGPMLTYGIETHERMGVKIRVTSAARTIVDCFRYRNKIGLDVALEAVRDGLLFRRTTVDAIMHAAEVCRARTVIKPYLEAILA